MKYFIVAGEESGERYGTRLVNEIKRRDSYALFEGIGGVGMKAAGVKLLRNVTEMAAIGIVEIFSKYFFYRKVLAEIKGRMKKNEFDAVILIDAPELNFRVAKMAHAAGIPVFYYVCPQLWAWRTYRVHFIKKWVDTMIVVFPFEKKFYDDYGVNAKFFGHPLLDEIEVDPNRAALRADLMHPNSKKLVGIMPGSRMSEIKTMLPELIDVIDLIKAKRPDVSFVIPVPPNIPETIVVSSIGARDFVKVIIGGSHKVMAANDFLITKSGTSTLEGAIIGTPMIIVYKMASLSYIIPKMLANIRFAGLPNILADSEIAIEYIQGDFKPEYIAQTALDLLANQITLEKKRAEMEKVRDSLGEHGAAGRAAEYIINRIKELV